MATDAPLRGGQKREPAVDGRSAAPSPLKLRVERGGSAAGLLDDRWDDLVRRQELPNPTLSTPWLKALVAIERSEPVTVAVLAEERLVAAAAIARARPVIPGAPHVSRWLGNPESQRLPDMLVDPEEPEAGRLLASALAGEAWATHFANVPLGGNAARFVGELMPWARRESRTPAVIAPLPPTGLRRARKKAHYYVRHALREGVAVETVVRRRPAEVLPALERLFVLHEQRWRGREGAVQQFRSEHDRWLYRQGVGGLARRGEARIVETWEDGTLVASNLCLLAARGAMFHTTATRLGGRLEGPGHVALLAMVEEAMEAGAEIMYLGRGLSGPKRRMRPELVPAGSLFVARRRAAQRALAAALILERAAGATRTLQRRRGPADD
jgi:hypothetical protein